MTEITSAPFGKTPEGKAATLYTFTNSKGSKVTVTNYGATIVSIVVPDRNGKLSDVVLGYDNLEGYLSRAYFFGASIGRCGNRIARGRFELNGKTYQLNCNEGKNHLHGGFKGFDTAVWDCSVEKGEEGDFLVLRHISPDGDENYPGKLEVKLTYSFNNQNELKLRYEAVSDADTICNLTNHSYFNLAGQETGSVLGEKLKLNAQLFTETDDESIPTGRLVPVEGTPMDFREYHVIGDRIDDDYDQLNYAGGYDHNWVLDKKKGEFGLCAELVDEASGRRMTCKTTCPCVQFYCGNYINGKQPGKNGYCYPKRSALCLETQYAPDAIHHPEWEGPVLRKGDKYDQTTVYRFDTV